MIRLIRTFTILAAVIFLFVSIFYVDTALEIKKAHLAWRAGDMDQVLRLARRVSFISSDDGKRTEALYLQARAAAKRGHFDIAVKYLDRLLAIDPADAGGLLFRGETEHLLGEDQQAVTDLDKGLSISGNGLSKSTRAHYTAQRGLAFLTLGRTPEAGKDAETALSLAPGLPDAWDLMSRVLETEGDIKGAYEACKKAYDLSIARDKLSFMTPKGRKLSDRLVKLRAQSILEKQ